MSLSNRLCTNVMYSCTFISRAQVGPPLVIQSNTLVQWQANACPCHKLIRLAHFYGEYEAMDCEPMLVKRPQLAKHMLYPFMIVSLSITV